MNNIRVNEVKSKASLVPSRLTQFTINPYLGCGHGCRYCYASMIMQRWHHQTEKWGEFVDVRVNTPQNVEKELRNKARVKIYMSSMTDCYQPIEKKYEITRKTLEVLISKEKTLFPTNISITIQTKSTLVLRDLDLIKQFKNIEVGLTITTLEDKFSKIFEPGASLPFERIIALEKLNKEGVKTYAFFGPVLPGISDSIEEMRRIFNTIYNAGTRSVIVDTLNYFNKVKGIKEVAMSISLFPQFLNSQTLDYSTNLKNKLMILKHEFKNIDFDIVF